MSDERIECVECGRTFIWSAGEQRYFREHGLVRPKHCLDCRSQRRNESRSGMRGLVGPPGGSWLGASQPRPAVTSRPSIFERIKAFLKRILS